MKRVLRILILGPIWLLAMIGFTLSSPIAALLLWLIGEPPKEYFGFIGEMWILGAREVWG